MILSVTKKMRSGTYALVAGSLVLGSCSSSTLITTQPAGAKLYMDGQYRGTTPYQHSDTRIVGSTTNLLFEKEGFEPLRVPLIRNEQADAGAIVGGIFLLFPFLWTMKYDPQHTYELRPLNGGTQPMSPATLSTGAPAYGVPAPATTNTLSRADRLRELKRLYDEKILTEKEYEAEKKKLLDSTDN